MLLVLAAAAALAQPEPRQASAPILMDKTEWERGPSSRQLMRAYPREAMSKGVGGSATIVCQVAADGLLTHCKVDGESPTGMGFGDAALSLATAFKARPTTSDGRSVEGGTVRIPLRFGRPAAPPTPQRPEVFACYGLVSHAVEQNPTLKGGWRGVGYWSMQILGQAMQRGAPPAEFEHNLALAHDMAAGGTLQPPKGWDLATCLAEVPKS